MSGFCSGEGIVGLSSETYRATKTEQVWERRHQKAPWFYARKRVHRLPITKSHGLGA